MAKKEDKGGAKGASVAPAAQGAGVPQASEPTQRTSAAPQAPQGTPGGDKPASSEGDRPEPVSPVSFGDLDESERRAGPGLPRSLLDPVMVNMSVELGRAELSFRELQNLTQGAIVDLDHMIGDPLEIRVNGHLIARGEVVSVKDERYGIRITEVVRSGTPSGQGDANL